MRPRVSPHPARVTVAHPGGQLAASAKAARSASGGQGGTALDQARDSSNKWPRPDGELLLVSTLMRLAVQYMLQADASPTASMA